MRFLLVAAVASLVAFSAGCASHTDPTETSHRGTSTTHAMNEATGLPQLAGQWTGLNQLWLYPGDPVRESPSEATVALAARGNLALLSYNWAYEGDPQEGVLMLQASTDADGVKVAWIDSWHTSGKFMMFKHDAEHEGLVAVRGSYSAGDGPDWGWRIVLTAEQPDEMHLTMYNITPDGEEALAVDVRYKRQA